MLHLVRKLISLQNNVDVAEILLEVEGRRTRIREHGHVGEATDFSWSRGPAPSGSPDRAERIQRLYASPCQRSWLSSLVPKLHLGTRLLVTEAWLCCLLEIDFADLLLHPDYFDLIAEFIGQPNLLWNRFEQDNRGR